MKNGLQCCALTLLMVLSNSVFATSTKHIELDPPSDSERAQGESTIKFTATLKNDAGTVLNESIEIWYENKQGAKLKTNTSPTGVVTIEVPKNKRLVYNVKAKSGTATVGPVKVTIVNVELKLGAKYWPTGNAAKGKLLATASHGLGADKLKPTGEADPTGTFAWTHPLAEKFNPIDGQDTVITAKEATTQIKDSELLSVNFTIKSSNEVCTASQPLNITAPFYGSSVDDGRDVIKVPDFPSNNVGNYFDSVNPGKRTAFIPDNLSIVYTLSDQFFAPMDQSDFGDDNGKKKLQCRENLPQGWGGFPAAAEWARANINAGVWTQGEWRNITAPPNSFTDVIGLRGFPLDELLVEEPVDPNKPNGTTIFHLAPALRSAGAEILTLVPHAWEVSIESKLPKQISFNEFRVTISDYKRSRNSHDQFRIHVSYVVKTAD